MWANKKNIAAVFGLKTERVETVSASYLHYIVVTMAVWVVARTKQLQMSGFSAKILTTLSLLTFLFSSSERAGACSLCAALKVSLLVT